MEQLTKQQLILLALLVSFVTSLATGIFTVSLMNQMPKGVAQTINQVVEKTIQVASSPSASFGTVAISVNDQVANAVDMVTPSVIKIYTRDGSTFLGLGLVISKQGMVMIDKAVSTNQFSGYSGTMNDGTRVTFTLATIQPNNNVTFLTPDISNGDVAYTPITFGHSVKLGQTVLALSGTSSPMLNQGIVTQLGTSTESSSTIITSIDPSKVMSGSPLFDPTGDVIGMKVSSLNATDMAIFYGVASLEAFSKSTQ